ncbi:MAG: hypothetical protein IKS48_02520 [Eubacterium sp.]|nr:hypothetical protein [Eubacterium sp.]
MAENYVLIDDIIKNHSERILNLRKFYPFFVVSQNAFTQFKDGRYKDLDMGYLCMAILRFFINENSFNNRPVKYAEYERFCLDTLKRDFGQSFHEDKEEARELVRYIFDKINNYGRAFELSFFDPAEKKTKLARVRLLDSNVREDEVVYSITEDGIEFYLSTKEVRDESRINMDQLLLEKMIKAENFRGGIDVIERINIEVNALEKRREEVVGILLTDVHAGTQAVDDYIDRTAVWFAEEKKSFARSRDLVDRAVARMKFGGETRSVSDITRLQTMLKQTIENHSRLIASTAELTRFSDEMVRRNRTRSLKAAFDFEGFLRRVTEADSPEMMSEIILPFVLPVRRKSFAISAIDNLVLTKTGESMQGEKKEVVKADLNFRYEDELLADMVGENFAKLFTELLGRIRRWGKLTLKEYLAILEVKFGKDVYQNRDLYSFLTHLAEKEYYDMEKVLSDAETFLEDAVIKFANEDILQSYSDIKFRLVFPDANEEDLITLENEDGDSVAELSNITIMQEMD